MFVSPGRGNHSRTMPDNEPLIWAVHDGKPGMASQALGLAEAVGKRAVEKRLAVRAPWRLLPPQFWLRPEAALGAAGDLLRPPWPDILVGCGRNSVAPALAAKRASRGVIFWVQIQDPRFAHDQVDLLVLPAHDAGEGANVFRTLGAVHRVTAERLAAEAGRFAPVLSGLPRPLVVVLLGGSNRAYRMTQARIAGFADQLAGLAKQGFGVAITPSRRTDPATIALLRTKLAGTGAYFWNGTGDNPYFALLGTADAIIVTADSVSMVSEAAATGKPLHIVDLDGGSPKFARFHQALREAGIARPFAGTIESWHYAPPDDTARAAAEIRRRWQARLTEAAA